MRINIRKGLNQAYNNLPTILLNWLSQSEHPVCVYSGCRLSSFARHKDQKVQPEIFFSSLPEEIRTQSSLTDAGINM